MDSTTGRPRKGAYAMLLRKSREDVEAVAGTRGHRPFHRGVEIQEAGRLPRKKGGER